MSGSNFVVHGANGSEQPIPIHEITDANGKRRLAVDAIITAEIASLVGEINLDKANDEVTIAGVLRGSQSDTTRPYVYVDALGQLGTINPSIVDSNNSTTSTLTAGSTFTGTATDISDYQQVNIMFYATPSTAKASFYFEFSQDGTNWDISVPALVRDPTFVIPVPVINVGRYFRVRYLNDGGVAAIAALGLSDTAGTPTTQTAFRMTTRLYTAATKELTRTIDQTIQGSDAVSLTRGVSMGQAPSGSYINVRGNGQDMGNSTTTPLGIGGVFTGTVRDVQGYVSGFLEVNTDRASATDGVVIQFSDTQVFTSVRSEVQTFSYTTGDLNKGRVFPFTISDRYMRVKYTNGGTAQSSFYLGCFLHIVPVEQPREALTATMEDSDLATLIRGPILAYDGTSWGNVARGPNGGLRTALDALRTIKATQQGIGLTAAQVTASPLANRRTIVLKNQSSGANDTIYIGETSGVSTGSGYALAKGEPIVLEVDGTASIYVIADGASRVLGILEMAE